jgi:hypothetical protein
MAELAKLPQDMVFFTQITMESAEDTEYLDAMRRANIKGALVGVEAVTPEGLKAVYKDFNYSGDRLVDTVANVPKAWSPCAWIVHLWTSFRQAQHIRSDGRTGPQGGGDIRAVVMMTPFPGTVDFGRWEIVESWNEINDGETE